MFEEAICQVAQLEFQFSVGGAECQAYENPTRLLVAVHASGLELGRLFAIHPQIRAEVGASESQLIGFLLNLDACLELEQKRSSFRAPSKYPPTKVDVALAIPSVVSFQDVESAILGAGGDLMTELQLFDVFEGSPLEPGTKSFAFHVLLQAQDRTLSEKEEHQFLNKVSKAATALGGILRQ